MQGDEGNIVTNLVANLPIWTHGTLWFLFFRAATRFLSVTLTCLSSISRPGIDGGLIQPTYGRGGHGAQQTCEPLPDWLATGKHSGRPGVDLNLSRLEQSFSEVLTPAGFFPRPRLPNISQPSPVITTVFLELDEFARRKDR